MRKIFNYFFKIPQDKLLHFIFGMIIFMVFSLFMGQLAIFVVIAAAVLKEFLDRDHTGFSVDDIIATVFGGALAISYYHLLV